MKIRLMEKYGWTPSEVQEIPLPLIEAIGIISEADEKKNKDKGSTPMNKQTRRLLNA